MTDQGGWNLIGMLDHRGGTGNAARANIEALCYLTEKHEIISFPSAGYTKASQIQAVHPNNYLHFNPACVRIEELAALPWFRDGKNIGYWTWETTDPPAAWKEYDSHMAQIWVPSSFVQESLVKAGFKTPVMVIPHAVKEQPRNAFPPADKPITFLVQFDGESRFARKRPDLALAAITAAALMTRENVRIVLKTHHPTDSQLFITEYPGVEVEEMSAWIDDSRMDELWSRVDVLVSLNRCEGFGLTLVEAMARGIAVVATCWGGSADYLTPENSYLVDAKCLDEVVASGDGYYKTGQWAKPDVKHATKQVIRCMSDIRSGRIHGISECAIKTSGEFTFAKMTERMKAALSQL